MEIGQYEMYPKDSKYVEQVLYEMATEPIQFAGKPNMIRTTIPEHYKSITAYWWWWLYRTEMINKSCYSQQNKRTAAHNSKWQWHLLIKSKHCSSQCGKLTIFARPYLTYSLTETVPCRNERHEDSLPNQLYFAEFERHVAEIAAFHLDR